jgi:predicted 3-demethylubiquinone-9 3-methyltransferase (glyoxalase superfamily)
MAIQQKIKNCLWFDKDAEEAVNYYMAAFKDSKITYIARYGDAGPGPKGQVMVVEFMLAGQQFMAINGGPLFKPNEAFSLVVTCEDQAEVDRLWDYLSKGGAPSMCGWLKDRWGFSWQIVPRRFAEMMHDKDEARKNRVFAAMLQMKKLDIAALEKAYAGT